MLRSVVFIVCAVIPIPHTCAAARTSKLEFVQHLLIQGVDRLRWLVDTEALWACLVGLKVFGYALSTGEFSALGTLFGLYDDHAAQVTDTPGVELGYGVVTVDLERFGLVRSVGELMVDELVIWLESLIFWLHSKI